MPWTTLVPSLDFKHFVYTFIFLPFFLHQKNSFQKIVKGNCSQHLRNKKKYQVIKDRTFYVGMVNGKSQEYLHYK